MADQRQSSDFTVLCGLDEIDDPGSRGFRPDANGAPTVFAVRRGNDVRVYRDICPHYWRTGLAWKRNSYLSADARHIVCSAHGAKFRIDDGLCESGPCIGQALVALPTIVCDGGVMVDIRDSRMA